MKIEKYYVVDIGFYSFLIISIRMDPDLIKENVQKLELH